MARTQARRETVTTAEAAFVAGLSLRKVQKAIDAGPIRPVREDRRRVLDEADLVYLMAMKELEGQLKPEARCAFYDAVKTGRDGEGSSLAATFGHDLKTHVTAVKQRLARVRQLRALVEVRRGRGPVIKGTTIEVHRIAALLEGGASIERVLADHPALSRAQVVAAGDYAMAHPKVGRPFPARSIKQAFDEAKLDGLADVLDAQRARR